MKKIVKLWWNDKDHVFVKLDDGTVAQLDEGALEEIAEYCTGPLDLMDWEDCEQAVVDSGCDVCHP